MITPVDLYHQDWLGDDRELIGFEKAGISRPCKPLVLGETDPPSSVLRHAYAIGASAWRIDNDFFFERVDADRWRWREVGCELDLPLPALAAPVQLRNAATAIAARSEEHTSELQSLMRTSYAVFCLKKKHRHPHTHRHTNH